MSDSQAAAPPPVTIIADPGATWRVPGEALGRSRLRLYRLAAHARHAGAAVFKPQLLRRDIYPEGSAEHALAADYELPQEWLPGLAAWCAELGLEFMCTVYRPEDVALVDPHVRRHKVASFEAGHPALLDALRRTKKPIVASMGAGGEDALYSVRWWRQVTRLHCVSAYPAQAAQMNLQAIFGDNCGLGGMEDDEHLEWAPLDERVGLSDHTTGSTAAIMAVAYGATVIEKHVRASDTPPDNPDYACSLPPDAFARFVLAVREAEAMMGDGQRRVMPGEWVQHRYDRATGKRGTA